LTSFRALCLLAVFVAVALNVVALRAEQTRAAALAVNLELEQVAARRELWRLQAKVARLRSPRRIQDKLRQIEEQPTAAARPAGPPES
jgi:hypothetical protein